MRVAQTSQEEMDGLTLHSASVNRTDQTRMSMTLGFHSVDRQADVEDPKRILVRRERLYEGNDRKRNAVSRFHCSSAPCSSHAMLNLNIFRLNPQRMVPSSSTTRDEYAPSSSRRRATGHVLQSS